VPNSIPLKYFVQGLVPLEGFYFFVKTEEKEDCSIVELEGVVDGGN